MEWVGFRLDHHYRATWAQRTLRVMKDAGAVALQHLTEVFGHLSFGALAAPDTRPVLGPVYAVASATSMCAGLMLPVMVRPILRFQFRQVAGCLLGGNCGGFDGRVPGVLVFPWWTG